MPTYLPCPACRGERRSGHYLCRACWAALPRAARRALARRDHLAMNRLRHLHDQLTAGVPVHKIEVSR
ncbi:hypothetical protein [Streptomyces youssoufiensis]